MQFFLHIAASRAHKPSFLTVSLASTDRWLALLLPFAGELPPTGALCERSTIHDHPQAAAIPIHIFLSYAANSA